MKEENVREFVHFTDKKNLCLRDLYSTYELDVFKTPHFKPTKAFWVSDEESDTTWSQVVNMINEEQNSNDTLAYEVDIDINDSVLILSSEQDIDHFTDTYLVHTEDSDIDIEELSYFIAGLQLNWAKVSETYKGVIITPYITSRRLSDKARWYYTWDCASGCIWDISCVRDVRLSVKYNT